MLRIQRHMTVKTTLKAQSQASHFAEDAAERLALVWLVTRMVWAVREDLETLPRVQRDVVTITRSSNQRG